MHAGTGSGFRSLEVTHLSCCAGVLAAASFISVCSADSVLNPKSYFSPDGRYECFVDPSTLEGEGPGHYRISLDGAVRWTGEKPFTLRDAAVTDDGLIVGYAYEGGVFSGGNHGTEYSGLVVVVMDSAGQTLMRDEAGNHSNAGLRQLFNASDSPVVEGLVCDAVNDRFAICVSAAGAGVCWWNYRLGVPEPTGDTTTPAPAAGPGTFASPLEIQLIPGTPLTLVLWCDESERAPGLEHNAILSVIDAKGVQVWGAVFAGEYDALVGDDSVYWALRELDVQQLQVEEFGFAFRSFSNDARVGYSLVADAGEPCGWRVEATGRTPDHLPTLQERDQQRAALPEIVLDHLGTIHLTSRMQRPSPIDVPSEYYFDSAGAIAFVRFVRGADPRFVRVSTDGRILSDLPLNLEGLDHEHRHWAVPIGSGRWFIIQQKYGDASSTRAWRLDPTSGASERVPNFAPGEIEQVEPTPEGGFVVRLRHSLTYTRQDGLERYDADGDRLWSRREQGYGQGIDYDSVAALTDGRTIALGHPDEITVFGNGGEVEQTWSISEIIGAEPNYAADVYADLNGGFIFRDFDGSPPFYRIDADRKVVAKFAPRYTDGTPIPYGSPIRVAPDGAMWTHDRINLLRLGEDGVVDRVIGRDEDDDTMTACDALCVDGAGRIYAINPRTHAIHTFTTEGEELEDGVLRMTPVDVASGTYPDVLLARADGVLALAATEVDHSAEYRSSVVGSPSWTQTHQFRAFSLEDEFQSGPLFLPNSLSRWESGYQEVALIHEGAAPRFITRGFNNNWLNVIGAIAADRSGRLVVLAGDGLWSRGTRCTLNIYEADGTPLRGIKLRDESDFARLALTRRFAITIDENVVRLYDLSKPAESLPLKFTIPESEDESVYWEPLTSPDESELWLHDHGSTRIERFRLP